MRVWIAILKRSRVAHLAMELSSSIYLSPRYSTVAPRDATRYKRFRSGRFTFVDAAWLRGTGFEFRAGADGTMPPTIEPKLGSDVGLVMRGGSLSSPMRFRGMPLARSAGLLGYEVRPAFFRFQSELRFLLP